MTQSSVNTVASALAHNEDWWRGAVIYQIYPRSFRDSNGDGIGDLRGIVEGLDHIASLGVDAIWLSPFFTSPMDDYGYDVSDYCGIDPSFGDFDDFDRIIEKAHGLRLKVIIDQVYSHTSDQHAWFQESRQNRTNPKADWYVWADAKPDGSPPSNWQSVFSGSAWQWDAPRKQYYLHNFLKSQPDLNLHNEEVQGAVLEVARFWLDRGVDGFRMDAINFAMHDPALRDNPPSGFQQDEITRPFDMQLHNFNQSHPDIPLFLEKLRTVMDEYRGSFTVAEVGGTDPDAEMKAFTDGGKRLDSAYSFDFLNAPKLSASLVKTSLQKWSGVTGEGWPSWAFSNHDAPRATSRWAKEEDRGRFSCLMMLLLTSLRGNPIIYQGEELGLPQGEVAFEDLKDPEAIANWPHTLGRDGARTPIPWETAKPHAGFTNGEKSWLKLDRAHAALAADMQDREPTSILNYARRLLSLRKRYTSLATGDLHLLDTPNEIIAYVRSNENDCVLCAFNLSEKAVEWAPLATFSGGMVIATEKEIEPSGSILNMLPPKSGLWAIEKETD